MAWSNRRRVALMLVVVLGWASYLGAIAIWSRLDVGPGPMPPASRMESPDPP